MSSWQLGSWAVGQLQLIGRLFGWLSGWKGGCDVGGWVGWIRVCLFGWKVCLFVGRLVGRLVVGWGGGWAGYVVGWLAVTLHVFIMPASRMTHHAC